MRPLLIRPASRIKGRVILPGDKSIAHRTLITSAIACGKTVIRNFPANEDCLATLKALQELGVNIVCKKPSGVRVDGSGLYGLRKPKKYIFMQESGTTFRLLLGLLSGQDFSVTLKAGKSLSGRPMRRVNEPLRQMGVSISSKLQARNSKLEEYPPITIKGGNLHPISYKMPVASAQVKSAILLAGLYTQGETKVIEVVPTRDHTERMLRLFKADIKIKGNLVSIRGDKRLISPGRIYIPADISSAAFFMVAAAILADSEIIIKNVTLNPARTGIVKVLKRMGANIKLQASATKRGGLAKQVGEPSFKLPAQYEPMGDIIVKSSRLKGVKVSKEEIPSLIDELPVLMVAACFARGKTVLEGVQELRVKETDRIGSMSENLLKMGAKIRVCRGKDGEDLIIEGVPRLYGASVRGFRDHRTAMSMIVAGLKAEGPTKIDDISCIAKSFPGFLVILKSLIR